MAVDLLNSRQALAEMKSIFLLCLKVYRVFLCLLLQSTQGLFRSECAAVLYCNSFFNQFPLKIYSTCVQCMLVGLCVYYIYAILDLILQCVMLLF